MTPWWHISEATFWAMAVGAVTNSACAILGCYLVLRRMSLLGDAISHAVLPGIVLAYLFSGSLGVAPILVGAMAVGLLTTALTESLHRFGNVPEDASMGVVFTSLFALGVILITWFAHDVHIDVDCVLYGLIEFVSLDRVGFLGMYVPRALLSLGGTLVAVIAFVALLWKELKIVCFDPALATAIGISATVVHYLLMTMVALVTVTAFEAVGSILVIAMLIVPAATAQLLTDRLRSMIACAVGVAVAAAVVGCWGATLLNTSSAGMMATVVGAEFALALFFAPRYGLVSKVYHNLQLNLRILGEDIVATLYRDEEARHGAATAPLARIRAAVGGGLRPWLALPRLVRQGEIQFRSATEIALTEKGRQHGRSLVRAHRLWESFIGRQFELPLDHLHAPAERIEHYLGPGLQAQLADELAQPDVDPHGREIPE